MSKRTTVLSRLEVPSPPKKYKKFSWTTAVCPYLPVMRSPSVCTGDHSSTRSASPREAWRCRVAAIGAETTPTAFFSVSTKLLLLLTTGSAVLLELDKAGAHALLLLLFPSFRKTQQSEEKKNNNKINKKIHKNKQQMKNCNLNRCILFVHLQLGRARRRRALSSLGNYKRSSGDIWSRRKRVHFPKTILRKHLTTKKSVYELKSKI